MPQSDPMSTTSQTKPAPTDGSHAQNEMFLSVDAGTKQFKTGSALDLNAPRRLSPSPYSQNGRYSPLGSRDASPWPETRHAVIPSRLWGPVQKFWDQNAGPIMVATAQLFAALMNLATRFLVLDEKRPMHPMQILFARMAITLIACLVWMRWQNTPNAPLGPRGLRVALVARGFFGFFGIYGMWYSLRYLPLADATVISFLAPNLSGYMCHVILHEPYTRTEQLASMLALGGVILITRPLSLFSGLGGGSESSTGGGAVIEAAVNATMIAVRAAEEDPDTTVTTVQRLIAIGAGLIGVVGASVVFTILRWIGQRAHPLHSVNYFSGMCIVVSVTTLGIAPMLEYDQPDLRFALPSGLQQWGFLCMIGICGFLLQFLLSAGLAKEKSNRATAMVYTHMLYAAAFDRFFFQHSMGVLSLMGCGCILGSAVWVAMTKAPGPGAPDRDVENRMAPVGGVETVPMMRDVDGMDLQEQRPRRGHDSR